MPNANLPSVIMLPTVPGIDDCDVLLHCCSRNGKASLYMRLQEFEWEGNTYYAAKMTFDDDRCHACGDLPCPKYFYSLRQAADVTRETARSICGNRYVMCDQMRQILKEKRK